MVLEANDREVTEACQRGDRDAFRVLFETYKDRVYSIALRYSGNEAAAMDITQDTFLKLMSRIGEFRAEANFESWLYRLVVNRCFDHHRGRRRLTSLVEEFLDVFTGPGQSVLHDLMRSEIQDQVQQATGKLPPEQRIVVILRYTEGLSYEEIAEALGCSTGTVGSRLNRAHKTLERRLAHLRKV